MGFRAVCIESRCRCSYQGGYLVVTKADVTTKIHLSEIQSLTFCTTQVYVSAYLMSELAKCKIPVVFCDEKSFPVAESLPLHGAHNCLARATSQLEWSLPSKKRLWQRIVRDKITAQAMLLTESGFDSEASVLCEYAENVRSGDPTNREAAAASLYFATLFGEGFSRDNECDVNAALNYGYAILLSKVCRELVSRGCLTHIGICHRSELNRWNLACDFMEPFRPFVDRIVVTSGLTTFGTGIKRLLMDMMNRTVPYDDGFYKFGSVIGLYVRGCLDVLDRKIDVSDLVCYKMP